MATFKHISSKNADYGAAEKYLTFAHDEFTMKPTLDENGRLVPRENYRIATIGCGEEDFAIACMRANLRYGKNQKREDVKSHHYIISFDPRDGPDHGLNVDWAQIMGEKFCKAHFPGHQALVCTHPDGHNGSGNIHVHIVINSLRIEEVPMLPYMDRPADSRAGCKHRCTDAAMEYFKSEVMEMCRRENLYQIDLLNGSANRITEREYWAKKKGQAKLDAEAAEQNKPPTKFETDKEKLRQIIREALAAATAFDEFSNLLLRKGVSVSESRGRLSYLTPDRTKPITARRLGDDFDKSAVLARLEQNTQHEVVKHDPIRRDVGKHDTPVQRQGQPQRHDNIGLQRMVDIEAKRAEGKGIGYENWAKLHNLKAASQAYLLYEQYGYSSREELDKAVDEARQKRSDSHDALKKLDKTIAEKKELQTQLLAYVKTRDARDGLKKIKKEKQRIAYRNEHESDFIISEACKRYFTKHGIEKLPTRQALRTEIQQLTSERNEAYNTYHAAKDRYTELETIQRNLQQLTQDTPQKQRKRSHELE